MTLNIDLEDVPDAILEAVKARILANRRRLLDQQEQQQRPALQPKPQFRKFGADSKTWKRPQPAAVPSGNGWLLVPTGPWQSSLQGFLCVVSGLPNRPLQSEQNDFEYVNNKLRVLPYLQTGYTPPVLEIDSTAVYTTDGQRSVPGAQLQAATFECFVDMAVDAPTAVSDVFDFPGYWYWEYVVSVLYTDPPDIPNPPPNPAIETRYWPPTGSARPLPPSQQFTWPQTAPGTVTSLVSETQVFTVPAENQESPWVATSDLAIKLEIAVDGQSQPMLQVSGGTSITADSVNGSTADAVVYVNAQSSSLALPLEGKRRLHFAFAINGKSVVGYVNGQALLLAEITALDPTKTYDLTITLQSTALDANGPSYVDPAVATLISAGNVRIVDASRHSVSGIRFTPSRALYQGSSFTPPSSINSLA